MIKAWLIGVSILVAVFGVWIFLLQNDLYSQIVVFILWASPTVAAFATSLLAPCRKILLGTSLAIPSALLAVVVNTIYQLSGTAVDFPGVKGGFTLFVVVLTAASVLAAVGSLAGFFARKNP